MELQGYLLIDSKKLKEISEISYKNSKENYIDKKANLEIELKNLEQYIKDCDEQINTSTKTIQVLEQSQSVSIAVKEGWYCFKESNKENYFAFKDVVKNRTIEAATKPENLGWNKWDDYSSTWRSTLEDWVGGQNWVEVNTSFALTLSSSELVKNMNAIIYENEKKSKFTTRKSIAISDKTYITNQIKEIDNVLSNSSITIKLDKHKLFIEGKKITDEKYLVSLTGRCLIKSVAPQLDEDEKPVNYDRYQIINRAVTMSLNANLDIIEHDSFELISYEIDELITIPANSFAGSSIVNILELNDYKYEDIKTVIDTGLEEIKKVKLPDLNWEKMFKRNDGDYADVYLNSDFSKITDGKIEIETTQQSTGIKETKRIWKGNYPLDRLIYTIQSNLDILMANRKINGDAYGNLYATLLVQAMQSATVLEQARIQAYEQASQFQIKSMIEYYLGAITAKLNVVKTLAEVSTTFLNKSLIQAQIKLYNIQTNGFKANNINKLFTTQFEGASTAFTSGMLDTPPAILNNADLMSLYTNVGSDMNVL